MASSGKFYTNAASGIDSDYPRQIVVEWKQEANVSTNKSIITYTVRTNSGVDSDRYTVCAPITVVLNGVTIYSITNRTEIHGDFKKTGSISVSHNSDGSKAISYSIKAAIYTYAVNCTCSGNITLNTIARASTISSTTPSVELGKNCNIVWSPKATSFYYKVKLTLGSWSWTSSAIHPNTTSAYTYTTPPTPSTPSPAITLSVANQLPSAVSGTMKATLYTYSNSACTTQIGSASSKTFTVTIPSTVIPTIEKTPTVTLYNSNSVVNGWGIYLKGFSKAKISCTGKGAYGSSISNYTISGAYSATVASMPYTTASVLNTSGTTSFTVKVKDSRGRTASAKSSNITVYDYTVPAVSSLTVSRGSTNKEKVTLKTTYSYNTVNGKNSVTVTLWYKKASATAWTSYPTTISNNTSITLTPVFEEESGYNFRIVVKDALGNTATKEAYISTTKVLIDFPASGKSLGIGKICEVNGLDLDMDLYIRGVNTYLGYRSDVQKKLFFENLAHINNDKSSGVYQHNTMIYGGAADSVNSIGIWDGIHSWTVCSYNDVSGKISIPRPINSLTVNEIRLIDSNDEKHIAIATVDGINDGNGVGVKIGAGGLTVIGSGESPSGYITKYELKGNSESIHITSDYNIYFATNCNTIANTKRLVLTTAGNLYPETSKAFSIGTNDLRFNYGYFNTIYNSSGAVTGSDERIKTDFSDINNVEEFIMGLTPVQFKYIDGDTHRNHWGFKAQEVKQLLDNVCQTDCGIYIEQPIAYIENDTVDSEDNPDEGKVLKDLKDCTYEEKKLGLRYEEFIAPLTSVVQKHGRDIQEIKSMLQSLINNNN